MGVCQFNQIWCQMKCKIKGEWVVHIYSFISYQFGIVLFYVSGKFFYFCSLKFAKISVLRDLKVLNNFIFKIFMVYKID